MKPVWQPLIPIRLKTLSNGARILQQAWGKSVFDGEKWNQTKEYEWRDVPLDIEDPLFWCQEVKE